MVKMDKKEELNDHLNEKCIINNDTAFCSLYYKAVKKLLDIDKKANISHLYRFAKIFNEYYDIFCHVRLDLEDRDEALIKQLKESLYHRIIYVYRTAALISSAVAFHFQTICKQDPNIINRLIKKKQVKICSIGGCSISDIVAIITVLKNFTPENDVELDFRVTIIDSDENWKNTCIKVLSCLEEFHEGTWKINFIPSNLRKMKTWKPEMLKVVQEADVVTMVRLDLQINVKRNLINMICNELKIQGILFILDRPYARFIEFCFSITNLGDFQLLHTELCDYHTLDIEAVKNFKTLYQKHFGTEKQFRCSVSINLFVCVWMKASSETDTKYKDNLECIFQANGEKYSAKQSFLSDNAFTKWKNLFTKTKKAAGWSEKAIKKRVQKEKGEKNNMFGKFISLKKWVDSLLNHLLNQVQWLENDRKDFNETNKKPLEDYLRQKSQYSLLKKKAYFSSLSANNLCSIVEHTTHSI